MSLKILHRSLLLAGVSTINIVGKRATTAIGKRIRQDYNITQKAIKKGGHIRFKRANSKTKEAKTTITNKEFPIINFVMPRRRIKITSGKGSKKPVKIRILKKAPLKVVKDGFIREGKKFGTNVFTRQAKERYPISAVFSLSAYHMVKLNGLDEYREIVSKDMAKTYAQRVNYELNVKPFKKKR